MKTLALIALLSLLISCGKETTKKKVPARQQFKDALSSLAIGQMIVQNEVIQGPRVSTQNVETCGRIFTRGEMKSIDLRNIEFCDETFENQVGCTPNEDMSYLTSDL